MPEEGVIEPQIEVTPTTSQQVIEAPEGVEGYELVIAHAVTSDIDSNIKPENIREGVTILGTQGSLVELNGQEKEFELDSPNIILYPDTPANGITKLTVTPKNYNYTGSNAVLPQKFDISLGAYDAGIGTVEVKAVTSAIDSNIKPSNIKEGVTILGVTGNMVPLNGETRTENLTSPSSNTFTPSSGKNGITQITVNAHNKDWTGASAITPTTSQQVITVPSGYSGNGSVTLNAVTSAIDSNIQAGNIKKDVTILGVTGTYEVAQSIITNINDNYLVRTNGDIELITNGTDVIGAKDTSLLPNTLKESIYMEDNTVKEISLSAITSIGEKGLYYAFKSCEGLTKVSLTSLTSVTEKDVFFYAFNGCLNLIDVDLSSLISVSGTNGLGAAFRVCTGLRNLNLSHLTTVSGNYGLSALCYMNYSLVSVDLSSLAVLSGQGALDHAFYYCRSLTTLSFPALTSTSFGSNTDQFNSMLYGVTGCTVHFPSNLQSVIGSWTDVAAGFGGTNTVVLFDLPSTENSMCILSNSSVLMADGSDKQAKDIKVGDTIKTYNEEAQQFEDNEVLNVWKNSKEDIIKVIFEDNSYIELTSGHPFLTEKGWASYDNEHTIKEKLYNGASLYQLSIGDKVLASDGSYLEIVDVQVQNVGKVDVYDFKIEKAHTFLCGEGNKFVLHNATSGAATP